MTEYIDKYTKVIKPGKAPVPPKKKEVAKKSKVISKLRAIANARITNRPVIKNSTVTLRLGKPEPYRSVYFHE